MRVSLTNPVLHDVNRDFEVAPGQSVLEAALQAGFNLPHSCKGGNCGSCRARLLAGEIHYPFGPPLGLSSEEAGAGLVLICQARARTDLKLETFELLRADEVRIKRLPCRIEKSAILSHDVMAVFLRLPAAESFEFQAGQYLDVILSGGRRRSFSIASPPHDSRLLELHVRKVAGGEFTESLFGAEAARTLLTIEGPLGQFTYRPPLADSDKASPIVMIGGGTGLAPLYSMLRYVVETGSARDMRLYWGVRSERDLYAHADLLDLQRQARTLRYVPVLSEPSPAWTGRTGFVHEAVLHDIGDLAPYEVYASGPPAMVTAVRREFQLHGVPASRLYFDSFDYAPDSVERQRNSALTKS